MNKTQMGEIADKVLRKRFFVIIPLAVFALIGWQFVRPKSIEPIGNHGAKFDNTAGVYDAGTRPEWCEALQKPNGYLLLSGVIDLPTIDDSHGFLQTDEEELGVFLDFDSGARVGIASKDGLTTRIQSGNQPQIGEMHFVVLIRGNGDITYIEDNARIEVAASAINPTCNSVQIGMGNESAPFTGEITVSISSGTDFEVAESLVDVYDSQFHSASVQIYNLSKNALIVALILLIIGNPFKKRESKKPATDELVI
jgi:hypothetical protein